MSASGLEVVDVAKAYAGQSVLAGVSLRVERGRSLVMLGASGTGKSTLLRIIAGLERADRGRILMDSVPCESLDQRPPHAPRIGLVFQGLELWPNLSVREHLAYGMPRGWSREQRQARVESLAAEVGLEPALLSRRPATLSGGEQQRVAMARTLGAEPGLLLFDEPLASLDPHRRQDLRLLIRSLAERAGRALLLVTHDVQEALALGDEIAVLSQGRVVDSGPPERLYRAPRTLASARALGTVNVLRARVHGSQLETALGLLTALPRAAEASQGLALLRPEQLSVGQAGAASENGRGEVQQVQPRGPDYLVGVQLGGDLLWARTTQRYERGAHVTLRAVSEAVFVENEESAP